MSFGSIWIAGPNWVAPGLISADISSYCVTWLTTAHGSSHTTSRRPPSPAAIAGKLALKGWPASTCTGGCQAPF